MSTVLAIAIGNKLYEESFKELEKKRLSWYAQDLSVKLADKYNHVIFSLCRTMRKYSLLAIVFLVFTRTWLF